MTLTCKLIKPALGVTTSKRGVGTEDALLTNLNAIDIDCCQFTANETLIYFRSNLYKLQKHLDSFKIRPLKSALLGNIYASLQNVLYIGSCVYSWVQPLYIKV